MSASATALFFGEIGLLLALLHASSLKQELKVARERLARAEISVKHEHQLFEDEKANAQSKHRALVEAREQLELRTQHLKNTLRLLQEKSKALPWLATMVADVFWLRDQADATSLEKKKHPAPGKADTVREHATEKKKLRIEKRLVEYRLALLEGLFPWLKEIGFADAEEIGEAKAREESGTGDPAERFLSADEWAKLSVSERSQRALDRYKKTKKSDWEIGREFERFIGYHWETSGHDVVYHGAVQGFDDFGRDLIVTGKNGKIALIQCKFWSKHKVIPEAAIFQLLGSTVSFFIEQTGHPPRDLQSMYLSVQPYLYSTAPVAERVRDIALAMGIRIKDNLHMQDWPMVKCNVAANGERIYHLPMDQQYDRIKLTKPGECYVRTVAEAEQKGFRRAKRWFSQPT